MTLTIFCTVSLVLIGANPNSSGPIAAIIMTTILFGAFQFISMRSISKPIEESLRNELLELKGKLDSLLLKGFR